MRFFGYFIVATSMLFLGSVGICQELENLTCQSVDEATYVGSKVWRDRETSVLYRFADEKLYLSSPDRDEYLYGQVTNVKSGLWFSSGYKAILFDDFKFEAATVIHTDSIETRIIRLHCVKT